MAGRAKRVSEHPVRPILDLQHRWAEALVKADTAALDAILVDSYVDTDESGSRFDKPSVLAALESGELELASITLLETHVHRYGNSAVLTGASTNRSVPGSTDRAEDTFYSHPGFAKRALESGRSTPNRRARSRKLALS
jgi:hypothetical protein